MENKKTWITVLIVVIIVIALVAAIWAGNKGETTEEEQIQEDQVTETQTNPEQEAPKNDAQVNEEGDAAQQAENQGDAETEMVEGTEQS